MIISIDPGVKACGVAVWEGDELEWAQFIPCLSSKHSPCWRNMAISIQVVQPAHLLAHLAIELPQVYDRSKSKGDPNDLIQLAAVVGAIVERLSIPTTVYLPREWKKQVPKDIMVERIKARLTPEETARVVLPSAKSLHHNVWDAVGIGLHHLGRLRK